jgi:hypothetical protein
MPASMLMIAVDWYGPFKSLASAKMQSVQSGVEEFLYFAISTDGANRSYVGLSADPLGRLTEAHHVLGGLNEGDIDLWIGIVSSQSEAGRRPAGGYTTHSGALHIAEHMVAYFLETTENQRKRQTPPKRSAVVFSRWFGSSEPWERRTHRAHPGWPDLIEFDAEDKTARLAWFGSKLIKYDEDQIERLKRKTS